MHVALVLLGLALHHGLTASGLPSAGQAGTCLPNAIPEAERTHLSKGSPGNTEPVPLTIFELGWLSHALVSNILQIIVTEVLGVNAEMRYTGVTSADGLYALAGCTSPSNHLDRGCPPVMPEEPDPAVVMEVWWFEGYFWALKSVISGYKVDNLGDIGYDGADILGGVGATQGQAYQTAGLTLEYYRSYNVSWSRPWEFFPKMSTINASRLMPCNETLLASSGPAEAHLSFTGDADGVTRLGDGRLVMKCWDGAWWRAPTCRYSPERCVPIITGGKGWFIETSAMMAVAYDMPLAIAVGATFEDYVFLSQSTGSMFYSWEPDASFVELAPFSIIFPPHDPLAWSRGDKRTSPPRQSLPKIASTNLALNFPVVSELVSNVELSKQDINAMLLAWKLEGGARTAREVACDWLTSNEQKWRLWIPHATACDAGMGLVDRANQHVPNRSDATSCQWCPAGTFSERLEDDIGITYACRLCPPGRSQSLPGQRFCEHCTPGTHAEGNGTVHCLKCPAGLHAEQPGQQYCQRCAPGRVAAKAGTRECTQCAKGTAQSLPGNTTCEVCPNGFFQPRTGKAMCNPCDEIIIGSGSVRGATSSSECLCPVNTFKRPMARPMSTCENCTSREGLDCPGGNGEPLQARGYWVQVIDADKREYSVYLCRNGWQCPHGRLGTCAEGRSGKACNSCEGGHYPVSDGRCKECSGGSLLLMILWVLLAPVIIFALLVCIRVDASTAQLTTVTAWITLGQLTTAVQALSTLNQLDVRFVDPARYVLEVCSLMQFELGLLRGPCLFRRDDPVEMFVVKLLVLPLIAGVLCIFWVVSKFVKRPIALDVVCNAVGVIATMFYIGLTLSVLLPLQCRLNPNDRYSMSTEPGLECFSSDTHSVLVILACLGILAYPVAILAWAIWATLRFSSLARTGTVHKLKAQRFFFARFKPDKYYFGLILLIRNTLVALIPVSLVGTPEVQCCALSFVLLVAFSLEVAHMPWRTGVANMSAVLMGVLILMVVVGVGPLVDSNAERAQQAISWYMATCSFGVLLAALGFFGFSVYTRCRQARRYGAFLCHHKAGAGALARLLKMLMQFGSPSRVFLDADELDDLERLFDVVRSDTWNLVVLLTGPVLSRVWCAGEIATAHRNGVKLVTMAFDGYAFAGEEEIADIVDAWTPQERSTLLTYDITEDMVLAAYKDLRAAPSVRASRSADIEEKEAAVQELLSCCQLPMRRFTWRTGSGTLISQAKILIVGAIGNMEVLASCQILKIMLQQSLEVPVKVVEGAQEMLAADAPYTTILVFLTPGLFENSMVAEVLLNASCGTDDSAPMPHLMPVLGDKRFEFPSAQDYAWVARGGLTTVQKEDGPLLVEAYKQLFSSIALPFTATASDILLRLEVSEMCRRRSCELGVPGCKTRRFSTTAKGSACPSEPQPVLESPENLVERRSLAEGIMAKSIRRLQI